jgi:putative membrane protein
MPKGRKQMRISRVMGVLLALAAASLVFTTVARADEAKKDEGPLTAKEFAKKAAEINMAEVQLAKFAERQTSNANVRGFSQGIQRDHRKAETQLKKAVATGTELPTELTEKYQKEIDRLKKLEGKEFDREYMKYMEKSHRQAINLYERAAKSVTSPELKQYIEENLKVLRTHLNEAQKTAKTIGD